MTKMKKDDLLALAKAAGIKGRHTMSMGQLYAALDFGADASDVPPPVLDSGVTLGEPFVAPDPLELPVFLRRALPDKEAKAKVDQLVQSQLYGKDRQYIMPGDQNSSYTDAVANGTPAQKAKKKGSTPTWVFSLGMDASDLAIAPIMAKLPKQARQIAEFVRSEGRVDYPKLIERARHFLVTKQEPERIVQYYRGLLIQSGVIKIVYDDPSIPVEDVDTADKKNAVVERVKARKGRVAKEAEAN